MSSNSIPKETSFDRRDATKYERFGLAFEKKDNNVLALIFYELTLFIRAKENVDKPTLLTAMIYRARAHLKVYKSDKLYIPVLQLYEKHRRDKTIAARVQMHIVDGGKGVISLRQLYEELKLQPSAEMAELLKIHFNLQMSHDETDRSAPVKDEKGVERDTDVPKVSPSVSPHNQKDALADGFSHPKSRISDLRYFSHPKSKISDLRSTLLRVSSHTDAADTDTSGMDDPLETEAKRRGFETKHS